MKIGEYQTKFFRNAGSLAMNVDGSSTPVDFVYTVPEGFNFHAARVMLALIENVAVNADEFGAIAGGGLDVGCRFFATDSSDMEVYDFLDGSTIKRNGDFASFAGVDVSNLAGNRGVGVRWTFSKASDGNNLEVDGGDNLLVPSGWKIVWRVQDDLESITVFTATLQGTIENA